ncbi:hypothetical protein D046_2450B, partial [Vibrio parahaemolyticus V-223/04]
RYV